MLAYVEALLQLAAAAADADRPSEAAALLHLVIGRCGPREADAIALLGQLTRRLGDAAGAEWLLRQALVLQPEHPWAHAELGETLRLTGQPAGAIPHLEKAIALNPTLSAAPGSLAAAHAALEQFTEALRWARAALAANPNRPEAHGLMGDVLARLGRAAEAIAAYDKALALRPAESRSRYGRGLVRLELGDLPDGWTDNEARLDLADDRFTQKLWRGQKHMRRRTILLHAEQGTADTIQFVRYATMVAKTGGRILLRVQRGVGRLCATVPGVAAVAEDGDVLPHFDLHCALLSLPAIFGTSLQNVPADVPYLVADDFVRSQWRQALRPWQKMRVGVVWRGMPATPSTSMPLATLAPLLARDDIECHVLQRALSPEDQAAAKAAPTLADHTFGLSDLVQTAALIAEMDLVIAVDSVEAHLAGALGVPTWVMLPHHANWRWLRDREDSPWYPTMRLFRQSLTGDWHSVLEQVAHNLDAWAVVRA